MFTFFLIIIIYFIFKKGLKSERKPTHSKVVFKKYFILYKGGIGSISAFYGLCAQFLLGDKNHRTSPWVNWGPHPCLPRRNVWGSYSAAVTEQVLSNGHSVWAEGVGKECYCTVCGFALDPVWQLQNTQAIKKCCVVWMKHNAANVFKMLCLSLRREPTKEKYSTQPTAAIEIKAFFVKFSSI